MQHVSSAALRKRRHRLVGGLPPLEQILRGSLIETYKRCGRPNCHCVDGPGHGPKRYLSTVYRDTQRLQPLRYLHDCSGRFRLERFAGWGLHPLESAAFARRTPTPDIDLQAQTSYTEITLGAKLCSPPLSRDLQPR
jgi:hypothetical protein